MVETGRGLLTLTMEEAGLERGVGQRLEPGDHPPPSAAMDTDLTCVTWMQAPSSQRLQLGAQPCRHIELILWDSGQSPPERSVGSEQGVASSCQTGGNLHGNRLRWAGNWPRAHTGVQKSNRAFPYPPFSKTGHQTLRRCTHVRPTSWPRVPRGAASQLSLPLHLCSSSSTEAQLGGTFHIFDFPNYKHSTYICIR